MRESDLETELRLHWQNDPNFTLDNFVHKYRRELAELVKPGNRAEESGDGYICSKCKSELVGEEADWHYCNNCLANFDCCEPDDTCPVCSDKAYLLLKGIYKKIIE